MTPKSTREGVKGKGNQCEILAFFNSKHELENPIVYESRSLNLHPYLLKPEKGMRIKGETTCLCSCAQHQSTFNHYKIRTRTRHGLGMLPCMRLEMLQKADEMEEIDRRR
jgi:hypothetical protein